MSIQDYVGAANNMLNQSIVKNYKFCKEYIDEYKDRKREIHYLQHDIELKKQEIDKLTAQMESERKQIEEDEQTLKEDALKFNEFLKQSDKVCIDAIKRAELESKLKQEKANEYEQLLTQSQVLKNEIAKKHDVLRELEEYQKFFDKLGKKDWTPQELAQYMSSLEQDNLDLLFKYQQIQQKDLLRSLTEPLEVAKIDVEKEDVSKAVLKHSVSFDKSDLLNTDNLALIIQRVYKFCIGPEQSLTPFQMLGEIETKVNNIMEKFDRLPAEQQIKIRKALDKKMREYEQEELIFKQKSKVEQKSKRSHQKKKVRVVLKKKNEHTEEIEVDADQDFFWK
eukprot:NODE_108_length_18904_cov_0.654826.p8 type:complete len:337 gc:universal NODE_108_length_18904_cov_0.654826:13051-12041(-)